MQLPSRTREDRGREKGGDGKLFWEVWIVPRIAIVAVENPVMHNHAEARIRNYVPFAKGIKP